MELSKNVDEFHVLARSKNNGFNHSVDGKLHLHLVPAIGKKSRWIYFSGLYLFYLIPKLKINLLLVQSAILGGLYATIASKLFRIPMMTEIHGDEYFRYLSMEKKVYFPIKWMIRYVYGNAVRIRSLNKKMTKKLHTHGFSKNVVELPNRVDLKVFNKQKINFNIDENEIKLITVGRFVPAKNYTKLIKCIAKSKLKIHLTLIGGGPLQDEYKRTIQSLGLEKQIKLIDWINQSALIDKIIASDIYVQYSITEGMPRTILEAMSLQMPIISSSAGSIEGVIDHNKNGLIIPINDCRQFLEMISKLKNDIVIREKLAHQAYQDILKKYEWNKVFNEYRTVLNEIFDSF